MSLDKQTILWYYGYRKSNKQWSLHTDMTRFLITTKISKQEESMLTLTKKGEKLDIQEMTRTQGGINCGIYACGICGAENEHDFLVSWEEWRRT